VQYLRDKFAGESRLEVVQGDVLSTGLTQWGPATIAGNLPYYITSPILEKIVDAGSTVRRAVVLVQKEVAERITAAPRSRDYGYLSVQMQLFAEARLLFEVKPAAFHPPPKVDSAVVRLEPHARAAELGIVDVPAFLQFAGHCFRQKRKTLRNNLLGVYGGVVDTWPEASLRAEQLPLETFAAMYRRLVS